MQENLRDAIVYGQMVKVKCKDCFAAEKRIKLKTSKQSYLLYY